MVTCQVTIAQSVTRSDCGSPCQCCHMCHGPPRPCSPCPLCAVPSSSPLPSTSPYLSAGTEAGCGGSSAPVSVPAPSPLLTHQMLYDIAKDQLVPSLSPHMDQSCKMKMFTPQSNYDEEVVPEDKAVQQIIQQEMKYKRELWRLEKVLRRGLASDDPLPVFNRRHLLLLVKRLCKDIESSTSQLRPDMDISRVSQVLESATTVSHGLICIAYADTLHEIREFLKREMTRTGDSATCFCHELHAERSLLPLHRLKYLKSLTCLSSNHNDVISSALDGCYVAISSLHSQSFVAEIDSLLDFALNMDPPPSSYFSAIRNAHIYQELISNDKSTETLNDHVYEEIGPYRPKKKRSFFSKNKPSKYNKDVSAQEEFLPLTNHIMKIPEIFA